jgi:hypothetical protein
MDSVALLLLTLTAAFAFVTVKIGRRLATVDNRWKRPLAIVMGASAGLAVALPLGLALNPFLGLQAGTYFNLMILVFCFGFLGLIAGSLGGLLYGGMILTTTSRTTDAGLSAGPAPHSGPARPLAVEASDKPRGDAPGASFGAVLAEAERPARAGNPRDDSGGER